MIFERGEGSHRPEVATLRPGQKFVDASVGEMLDDRVTFYCRTANGRLSIQLPRDIVPPQLLIYGQPVRITLGSRNGVRHPVIEARYVAPPPAEDEDEDSEFETWLRSP